MQIINKKKKKEEEEQKHIKRVKEVTLQLNDVVISYVYLFSNSVPELSTFTLVNILECDFNNEKRRKQIEKNKK